MKYHSLDLLDNLQSDVRDLLVKAQQFSGLSDADISRSPAPGKWSIAQVLEHLNIYCNYYINAIEARLHRNKTGPVKDFRSGWLGNYFTHMMLPKNGTTVTNKMKSPKNARPAPQPNGRAQLEQFISHQHHLLNLLQIAKGADLNSIRIPISLTPFIKLKLGDTFRFFIAHQQRHFIQIATILESFSQ